MDDDLTHYGKFSVQFDFILDYFFARRLPMAVISPMTSKESADHIASAAAKPRKDQIRAQLRGLLDAEPDIEATAVVSIEGVIIASSLKNGLNDERVASMTAAMVGLGERIALELGRGRLDQVVIRGDAGSVILVSINDAAVLTAVVKDEMQLGLMFLDMRKAAADLSQIL